MIEAAIVLFLLSIVFDLVAHRGDSAVIWAHQLSRLLFWAAMAVLVVAVLV